MVSTSWAVERRPEPDFEVEAAGLLYVPPEIRPNAQTPLISHELGEIEDICRSSERMCRRLTDEALKIELQTPRPEEQVEPASNAASQHFAQGIVYTDEQSPASAPTEASSTRATDIQTKRIEASSAGSASPESLADTRRRVIEPLLAARGWSTLDWANQAGVDFNTASGYLNGLTKPRRDTRKKLADAIGVPPVEFPD